jgi:Flp pilus assembly secretin CpaC
MQIFQHTPSKAALSPASAAALISLAWVAWCGITEVKAEDLVVRYDQSQLLRLPRPATEIIVGNPSIADVSLQGGNLLVVTGKTFGITNIIALDAERNVIQDQRVMVERDDRKIVNLMKGSSRQTYSCTPNCEPNLAIGDAKEFFDSVNSANTAKTKFSEGAAEAASAGGNSQ